LIINRKIRYFPIITVIILILHILGFLCSRVMELQNARIGDSFFKIRYFLNKKEKISPHLVVFHLDDTMIINNDFNENDRFFFGNFIKCLARGKTKTILFDILFRAETTENNDNRLIDESADAGNVFYPVVFKTKGNLETPEESRQILKKFIIYPQITSPAKKNESRGELVPFISLIKAAEGLGGISQTPDGDGIIRRIPLVYPFDDGYIPSLVLAGICHFYNTNPGNIIIIPGKKITLQDAEVTPGRKIDIDIPVDKKNRLVINFAGPWNDSIESFSMSPLIFQSHLFSEENLISMLEGTIVLVAEMTSEKKDFTNGIFDMVYPQSGIISNAVNSIMTGNYLKPAGFIEIILFPLIITGMLYIYFFIAGHFLPRHKNVLFLLLLLFYIACFFVYNLFLFMVLKQIPEYVFSLLTIIVAAGVAIFIRPVLEKNYKVSAVETTLLKTGREGDQYKSGKNIEYILRNDLKLTQKEANVAALLLDGKQYKEISHLLDIATSTVRIRVHKIYKKCNVDNKIEFSNLVRGNLIEKNKNTK